LITKLVVLNGTEGHRFEVGKKYTDTNDPKIVKDISQVQGDYLVEFEDSSYADVKTNNVLVFYK
jgi:hypothetical protein